MRRVAVISVLLLVCLTWAGPLAAQPMGGWSVDLRWGGGRTTLMGASEAISDGVEEGLAGSGARNVSIEADDSGFGWMAGFDLRRALGPKFDIGVGLTYTRPSNVTGEFSGQIFNTSFAGNQTIKASLFGVHGQVGVWATPRLTVYGGGGLRQFDYEDTFTLSAQQLNISQSETLNSKGTGTRFFVGTRYYFAPHFGAFFEGGRVFMDDEETGFDHKLSMLMVGLVVTLSFF